MYWYIDGANDAFMKKFFALVMGMQGMLEAMFDEGLATMKPIAEAEAQKLAAAAAQAPEGEPPTPEAPEGLDSK